MTDSFAFDDLEFFTVGTLGPKGQRIFYLQGRGEGTLVSLKLEKLQVEELARSLDHVIDRLPDVEVGPLPDDLSLREPVISSWTVRSMAIRYEMGDRIVLIAEELTEDDEQDPAIAQFSLRREQAIGLIHRAHDLVAAGRPPCLYCGRPLEPRNGDWCLCQN